MSGSDQNPPPEADLSSEDLHEIRVALLDLLTLESKPELAGGVMERLGIEEEGADLGALLRQTQDDQVPELADSVLERLGLSDQVGVLADALRDDSNENLKLDQEVIAHVVPGAPTLELSALLRETLVDPHPVSLEDGILEQLGLEESSVEVGDLLRELVEEGGSPEIAASVMSQLGLEESFSIGDLLGPDEVPNLWAAVEADIGHSTGQETQAVADGAQDTEVVSFTEEKTRRRRWAAPTAVWLAAAAALIFVFAEFGGATNESIGSADESTGPAVESVAQNGNGQESSGDEKGSDLNEDALASSEEVSSSEQDLEQSDVIIEKLDSEANAFVQVLQFDEDAPPIIFITELDDPSSDASEGATL